LIYRHPVYRLPIYLGSMRDPSTQHEGLGRNSEVSVLILSSLAGGPKHGYALIKDVQEFSGVRLSPGTLYEALARLEKRGLIEALDSDERRRPYQLTSPGATLLLESVTSHQRVITTAKSRLKTGWSFA
jgi:DNA-binding PadR family transcriptional regulator